MYRRDYRCQRHRPYARPASEFVTLAGRYQSRIQLQRAGGGDAVQRKVHDHADDDGAWQGDRHAVR